MRQLLLRFWQWLGRLLGQESRYDGESMEPMEPPAAAGEPGLVGRRRKQPLLPIAIGVAQIGQPHRRSNLAGNSTSSVIQSGPSFPDCAGRKVAGYSPPATKSRLWNRG